MNLGDILSGFTQGAVDGFNDSIDPVQKLLSYKPRMEAMKTNTAYVDELLRRMTEKRAQESQSRRFIPPPLPESPLRDILPLPVNIRNRARNQLDLSFLRRPRQYRQPVRFSLSDLLRPV